MRDLFSFFLHTTSHIPPLFHTTIKLEQNIKHFCAAPKACEILGYHRYLDEVFAPIFGLLGP
jgi:hypothetical protein